MQVISLYISYLSQTAHSVVTNENKRMHGSLEQKVEKTAADFLEDDRENKSEDENFSERNDNFPPRG